VDRLHRRPHPGLGGRLGVVGDRRALDLQQELRHLRRLVDGVVYLLGGEEVTAGAVEERRSGPADLLFERRPGAVDGLSRVRLRHEGDEVGQVLADGRHLDARPGPEVRTEAGDGPLAGREADVVGEERVHAVVPGAVEQLEPIVSGVVTPGSLSVVGHGGFVRLPASVPGARRG